MKDTKELQQCVSWHAIDRFRPRRKKRSEERKT